MAHLFAKVIAFGFGLLFALPAWAEARAALIVQQHDYRYTKDIEETADLRPALAALKTAEFAITASEDGDERDMLETLDDFLATLKPDSEAVIVTLSGHFVTTGSETYLLTRDFREPATLPRLLTDALPLSAVLAPLGQLDGSAALLLSPSDRTGDAGPFAKYGISTSIRQAANVTILTGELEDTANFMTSALLVPDTPILTAARAANLEALGTLSLLGTALLISDAQNAPAPIAEPELWSEVRKADTISAYRRYLAIYPEGTNATKARALIKEIETEPNRAARLAEASLTLSRDNRRKIQRDLSILGYNTRGIDGIFGPGTRGAIKTWQDRSGFDTTTYLTGNQIAKLSDEARLRAAELEEEARRKQAEENRRDRAFWEETGAFGDEAGYRAYLERYPDGLFAQQAKRAVAAIEEKRRAEAQLADTQRWRETEAIGTPEAYSAYLAENPNGAYRDQAQRRINQLTRDPRRERSERRAFRSERGLGLDPVTRQLIEGRLAQLGLRPGPVDGRFDERTRRAIRNYQKARSMPVTGFIDDATAVQMLADVFQ